MTPFPSDISAALASSLLPVTSNVTALQLADTMFGDGVTIVAAKFTGDPLAVGIYSNGLAVAPDVVPSDSGVILSTGRAAQFTNATGAANKVDDRSTDTSGQENVAAMNAIAGVKTFDTAFLDATFIPVGDTLTMRMVFASEEYPEWVNSGYNDAVGIWVNGVKVALTIGDGDISIDNINSDVNANLYRDNNDGAFNTEMDGLTLVLTLKAPVIPGQENTLRIGIADAGDAVYDSSLLIVADSIQTALIAQDDTVAVTNKGDASVSLLDNDTMIGRKGVVVSHLNDVAVTVDDIITLPTGDKLRLNADGTVTVWATATATPVTFSYTITDATGTADTAFVTVTPSPVDGTAGNDQMMVGYTDADGNSIDGADGMSEVIFGYGGNDKIFAGLGDDDIHGGDGNDFVRAGAGDDLLVGGAGNDVLDGETGTDTMEGGAGNDVFYIDDAGDVINETANAGYDKVISDLSHVLDTHFEELWLREGSAGTDGTGNASANKIVGNANANTLSGLDGKDQLFGEDGDDLLFGGTGDDVLWGGAGNDRLFGDAGNDKIYGGLGADSLDGGAGNDALTAGSDGSVMDGGAGNDILGGGAGADVFVFRTGSGRDTVKHFELGQDQVLLDGIDIAAVKLRAVGTTLQITWGTSDLVSLSKLDGLDVASLYDYDLFV